MTRTFHARVDRAVLLGGLLPGTVPAVCFLWMKMPLPALFFLLLMVVMVERLVHTVYVLDDEGCLRVSHGRFSRTVVWRLSEVDRVELHPLPGWLGRKRSAEAVRLVDRSGRELVLCPADSAEFCHVLLKKKEESLCSSSPS